MDNSKLNRRKLHKNIFKVLIATAVFYVGLFSFSKKVGEQISYIPETSIIPKVNTRGSLQEELQKENKENKDLSHLSIKEQLRQHLKHRAAEQKLALLQKIKEQKIDPYEEKIKDFCRKERHYCTLIDFNGMNIIKKQYLYLSMVKVIEDFIGRYQQFGQSIFDVLEKIDILNKKWSPRAYASWSVITVHGQSVSHHKEFFNLIGHEIGHIIDLGVIQWNSRIKDKNFTEFGKATFEKDDPSLEYYALSWVDEQTRKEDMNKLNFCSKYGMSNPFEDFAECHNLYLNHNKMFFALAKAYPILKKKYNFFANFYDGNYLFDDSRNFVTLKQDLEWRVWDTTRLDW